MGIQLRNSGGSSSGHNAQNQGSGTMGTGNGGTPNNQMQQNTSDAATKEALMKKQEEMRQKALAFEEMEARKNPELAAERKKRLAQAQAEEEQRARFRAEEEAKIEAERRVQEKSMDQTEALIAAIRAQVEKEKAAKEAANQQAAAKNAASSAPSSGGNPKPQFRTISPEEMAKLEEKKRMKAAGIQPSQETNGAAEGVSGGLGGLGNGPTLSNPSGNGPTLSNPTAGQAGLNSSGVDGGGLGIDITASADAGKKPSDAEESTVALNTDQINAAVEKSQGGSTVPPKPHTPTQVVGGSSTIVVDDGSATWGQTGNAGAAQSAPESSWVDSGVAPQQVQAAKPKTADSLVDDNGDIISVVPVRQKPNDANDVQSAYNIDFDGDDDDDDMMQFGSSASQEEAKRKAEEEARQKAEEEARRRAEEEARQKAEEEARRRAEEEARQKAEEEARRKAEEEARRKAEEEARRKAEEEARQKAEEEARQKAEEEARRKAEEEARRKAEEEARRKAEEEARRKAEEEARRKAEEEARRQAEEEARRKAEEEARRQAEEEARRKAEEEARIRAEEEARRKAEEEARRKAEEEARIRAEEEARRKAEEEARIKAEEEARRKAEEEALKYKQLAEEAARKAEEAARALEAAKSGASAAASAETTSTGAASTSTSGEFNLPVGAEQFLGKYLSVSSIGEQFVKTMQYISSNPSEPRNIVILGQYGFGTTTIAEDFARSFHAMGLCKTKTIAKIKAGALNRANISDAIAKLQGGCLVVENAGVITPEKLNEIYQIVSDPNNDVVVIMTGQIETLSKLFKDNVVISSQFKHLIQVHRITDMDVFAIAKNHAVQLGYPCEPSAESNLRRRMQEVESGNLDRVLKIVDNAVSKAHNREMNSGEQEHHLISSDFE